MQQLRNPMNFYCAPNMATPDYISYTDFRNWLAYGLWVCWIGDHWSDDPNSGCELARPVTHEDVRELRSYYLDLVETVVVGLWKSELEPGQGDVEANWQYLLIEDEKNPETNETLLVWYVRLDESDMMFELSIQGSDSQVIWLDYSAIENRKQVLEALQEARRTLRCDDFRGEVWSDLVALVG